MIDCRLLGKLLLQPRASREGALNRAIHVAEQILDSLARPFVLEGREFFVTASIGIALSPQDGRELSQLMKNADTAMYHAKERGKNNFQFYQADMNARALERLELESDLRHALEQGEFLLYYQPQFSGDGRRLTALDVQWAFYERHPWVLQLVGSRATLGPHELASYERSLALFDGIGLAGVEMMLHEVGVPLTLGAGLGAAQAFLVSGARA